ncbi:MAG: PHP domain-containing protein [Thomasclavelia sp.]|nr:PHP domain-containing protein [Thomasclavelia sp.]
MYYDLHIHSALSPCGDNTMTINNIVNMAYIKGLDLIAITDHNSMRNLTYLDEVCHKEIVDSKIDYIYGVEIESKEKIHILGYFKKETDLKPIQAWLDTHLKKVDLDENYYGEELVLDEDDKIIDKECYLLIESLDIGIKDIIHKIHSFNGIVVLAHVLAKKYGCYEYFKDIPDYLDYDALEVTCLREIDDCHRLCPSTKDKLFLINSDAHNLEMINEPMYQIDKDILDSLWR